MFDWLLRKEIEQKAITKEEIRLAKDRCIGTLTEQEKLDWQEMHEELVGLNAILLQLASAQSQLEKKKSRWWDRLASNREIEFDRKIHGLRFDDIGEPYIYIYDLENK